MMTTVLENVREKILTIKRAINEHDDIVDNVAESRFKLEQLRRRPEYGQQTERGKDGKPVRVTVLTPEQLKISIESLETERALAEEIVVYLTGREDCDGLDAVRDAFTSLLVAHTRVVDIKEQLGRLGVVGHATLAPSYAAHGDTVSLEQDLDEAMKTLVSVAELFSIPEPSDLDLSKPRLVGV